MTHAVGPRISLMEGIALLAFIGWVYLQVITVQWLADHMPVIGAIPLVLVVFDVLVPLILAGVGAAVRLAFAVREADRENTILPAGHTFPAYVPEDYRRLADVRRELYPVIVAAWQKGTVPRLLKEEVQTREVLTRERHQYLTHRGTHHDPDVPGVSYPIDTTWAVFWRFSIDGNRFRPDATASLTLDPDGVPTLRVERTGFEAAAERENFPALLAAVRNAPRPRISLPEGPQPQPLRRRRRGE